MSFNSFFLHLDPHHSPSNELWAFFGGSQQCYQGKIDFAAREMGTVKYSKSGDLAEGALCNECWKGGGGEKIKPCC